MEGSGRARRSARSLAIASFLPAIAIVAGCEILVPGTLSNVRCMEEGAVGPPVCPLGTFCRDGVCRDGPRSLGEPCDDDDVCAPGDSCVDPAQIALTGDPFCSRTCCSSADCGVGTGLVCAPLGPGKLCVPAELWDRDRPGTRFAGEPCSHDGECRSGACTEPGGYCLDTCCSDAECASFGGICAAAGFGWSCGPALVEPKPPLAGCERDSDCASGVCAVWADGKGRCAEPCCSSNDCPEIALDGGVKSVLCVPIPHGTAIVYACAALADGPANRPVGEPCDDAGQCRGGLCVEVPATDADRSADQGSSVIKVCSDVCCTDESCGAPHLFTCAPPEGAPPVTGPISSGGQGFGLQCRKR